ncbi:MAG TPA: hypothetical protein VI758_03350 [Bacteroidota bacterium]
MMIGEAIYALVRIAIFFFVFYFFYRIIVGFFRGLMGDGRKQSPGQQQQQPPQKPIRSYTDVEDAKFKDIPPGQEKS